MRLSSSILSASCVPFSSGSAAAKLNTHRFASARVSTRQQIAKALKVASNGLVLFLELYLRSPESGGLRYKSGVPVKTIYSHSDKSRSPGFASAVSRKRLLSVGRVLERVPCSGRCRQNSTFWCSLRTMSLRVASLSCMVYGGGCKM